jgi:WhiB family redox-sensing transcriptional regulator
MPTRRLPLSERYIPSTPWIDEAACKGKDPSIWFPVGGTTWEERRAIRDAVEVCQSCVVVDECLDHSLLWEREGIWGGKTQREREVIRRRRNIALSVVPTRVSQ